MLSKWHLLPLLLLCQECHQFLVLPLPQCLSLQ